MGRVFLKDSAGRVAPASIMGAYLNRLTHNSGLGIHAVTPAPAGVQRAPPQRWIPACAGMTTFAFNHELSMFHR